MIVKNANMYGVIRQIKRCRFHQIKTGLSEHLTMDEAYIFGRFRHVIL